ncbi:fimbrial protein [Paraburkholderia bannensis]|uniref:fimbrial protein n=1 Tax=Paraburkholderia bannensis TaxID=765414 RepID=UPI0004811A2C|nr:fimbrial protein [Paraburkholderia bannensis]
MHKLTTAVAILASVATTGAFAADATLTFSGTILPASCTIDSTTANQTINLGSASVADFPAVGATKNPQAFNMQLTDCTTSAKVSMNVAGTMDTVASVLKNTGTATQIGVQLLQASAVGATTGTPITLNSAINLGTVDATNSMTIPMVAQLYRIGAMTAGSITTTATVNFTYN